MLCTELTLVKSGDGRLRAEPLWCKRWSCQFCRSKRRKRLIMEAKSGNPTSLLTLTVNPKTGFSPDDRARRLVVAWRELRRRIKKRYGLQSLPFMAVFEATKRGEPHLHILLRTVFISQKFISQQMADLINSPIVDIRKIDQARDVASYVAKYIGKNPHTFEGVKRYWRSLDYLPLSRREWKLANPLTYVASIVRVGFMAYCQNMYVAGYTIFQEDLYGEAEFIREEPPPWKERYAPLYYR